MVAVNGFFYRFDFNRSLGIGVYRCNVSIRFWYECVTYRIFYFDVFQCVVVDDFVYCVGRQRIFRFLVDYILFRFMFKELRSFFFSRGIFLFVVLTLFGFDVFQIRVQSFFCWVFFVKLGGKSIFYLLFYRLFLGEQVVQECGRQEANFDSVFFVVRSFQMYFCFQWDVEVQCENRIRNWCFEVGVFIFVGMIVILF